MKSISSNNKMTTVFERKEENDPNLRNYKYPGLRIGVIMPAFNEEKNIGKTLSLFPDDISDNLDVIVVDDGSRDKTCEIAQSYEPIIIKHKKNKGNGAAIQTGLEFCRQNHYEIVIILDADGQHDPRDLPKFIDPIIYHGVDFVIGNRFKHFYNMGIVKKLLSRTMSIFYTILLQKKISDPTMGYRALSSKLINTLAFESKYSITQEMLFKIVPHFSFREVNTRIFEREFGESFISIRKYLNISIMSIMKFYLFPKFNKIINKALRKSEIPQKIRTLMQT
ncbi:MAG: glycosyltransferase family 2 protein [Promethearchaeota archaeon]